MGLTIPSNYFINAQTRLNTKSILRHIFKEYISMIEYEQNLLIPWWMTRYCKASFQSMAPLADPLVTSYNSKLTQGKVNNVNQLVTHTVSRPLFQTDCSVCFTKYFGQKHWNSTVPTRPTSSPRWQFSVRSILQVCQMLLNLRNLFMKKIEFYKQICMELSHDFRSSVLISLSCFAFPKKLHPSNLLLTIVYMVGSPVAKHAQLQNKWE